MRLINAETLEFQEFAQVFPWKPFYYILSHRWQEDEISYKDLRKGRRKDSQGYQKVLDFCRFALKRHQENKEERSIYLRVMGWDFEQDPCYIWIDTCCIDKTSSAELSLSINSMYGWYRHSWECHVHLSDVHGARGDVALHEELRKSSWFGRGWTLQELLAPDRLVLMLNSNWNVIGKIERPASGGSILERTPTLETFVTDITGIQSEYLNGSWRVSTASVACRMSWASWRETTLKEDEAYCLMGLFDVNMPLLYGEGEKAFQRLQQEIIKSSVDHSIFAHDGLGMLLAVSPWRFRDCGNIHRSEDLGDTSTTLQPYEVSNLGIRFHARISAVNHEDRSREWVFRLECYEESERNDGPSQPIYLVLGEKQGENVAIGQPLVIEKRPIWDHDTGWREHVVSGERRLRQLVGTLKDPVYKTFYVWLGET